MRDGTDKSTVSRYQTIGEAFAPGWCRASVADDDMGLRCFRR
ncbi:hypothetical protein [Longimicrobium terrae]|uniref:Uncharacterized protein n=1 Tax=Longimicrobium terrae TaxID=1639882 RepID=A0A841GRN8_9BACT|nr:hypothetical protein [Longimicrobium terrae]MBB4635896.1 hypothetical protein [Longimicrobium terrae]MBB6070292.1 hypothetical protein [Longimicrobium terrae]